MPRKRQSEAPVLQEGSLLTLYREIESTLAAFDRTKNDQVADKMLGLRLCLARSVPSNSVDALVVTANASRAAHALSQNNSEIQLDEIAVRQFAEEIWWGLASLRQYLEREAQTTADELGLRTMIGPPMPMQ